MLYLRFDVENNEQLNERRVNIMKFALPTRVFVKEKNECYNVYLDNTLQKSFIKKEITNHYDAHYDAHLFAGVLAEKYNCMFSDEGEW